MYTMEQIDDVARALLIEHNQLRAPVDVFAIIENEGVDLIFADMEDDHSGLLLVEDGAATIAINDSHHRNRQRFTASHELGHFKLHCTEEEGFFVDTAFNRSALSSEGTNFQEIQANRFAAALLMPEEVIAQHVGDKEITDTAISLLSLLFEVSEQAMTLRLVKLGYLKI